MDPGRLSVEPKPDDGVPPKLNPGLSEGCAPLLPNPDEPELPKPKLMEGLLPGTSDMSLVGLSSILRSSCDLGGVVGIVALPLWPKEKGFGSLVGALVPNKGAGAA